MKKVGIIGKTFNCENGGAETFPFFILNELTKNLHTKLFYVIFEVTN